MTVVLCHNHVNIAALRRLLWLWGLKMRNGTIAFSALRALRALRMVAALGGAFGVSCAVAAGLNDTGVTTCSNASGTTVSCTDAAAVQGQDARYGRDAAAGTGALTKVGGGANGFDFTKISNAGAVLQPTAALGTGPNDWGCTYDNTTGLMWEIKASGGLHSYGNSYTWFSSNSAANGGAVGVANGSPYCYTPGRCDTEKFTQDVNVAGMCSHNDWRMPTFRELQGLVLLGASSTVDGAYFPNTNSGISWSSSPVAGDTGAAWGVDLTNGTSRKSSRGAQQIIRLVRSGR